MALNLHLLRLFAAVAERRSFSRAAETLIVSQPAVSKGVRELERQLGAALLDRSQHTLALTPAGEIVYHAAQRIFAAERAAETELAQLRDLERGRLAIGASMTAGVYLLPAALSAFRERRPAVELFLDIGVTSEMLRRLRDQEVDVAFVEGMVEGEEFEVARWREDTLVVIAASAHPLAQRERPSLDVALAEPFVQREPGAGTREIIDEALRARGIQLRAALEVGNGEAVKQMVAAGLGLAIVSEATIAAERALDTLRVLDVPELTLRRWLWRVTLRGRPTSHALAAFLPLAESLAPAPRPAD